MRLLITTQAVDLDDPVMGFFHGWLNEFSEHFASIDVICLKEGRHNLPSHVRIYSLGKEDGENRLKYIFRFFSHLLRIGPRNVDVVFSHMNPHYIVLAGWWWTLWGTRIFFWRNHARMNIMTRIAAFFAERVFYTSPYACTRVFKNSKQMPVGIDTKLFTRDTSQTPKEKSVLFLGRLSPVKNPLLFAQAAALLKDFTVRVYGDEPGGLSVTREKMKELSGGTIEFHPAIPNYEAPSIYAAHEIYINLTPEGSMDKTVLEAAACGALVLVTNKSFKEFVPPECLLETSSPEAIAGGVKHLSGLTSEKKEALRQSLIGAVLTHHSLRSLAKELKEMMDETK